MPDASVHSNFGPAFGGAAIRGVRADVSVAALFTVRFGCFVRLAAHADHGSKRSIPKPSKSFVLRVAKVSCFAVAVAAIKPSMDDRPRPRRLARAIRSPQAGVIGSSTCRTLYSKRCGRSCASHSARVWRFRPPSIRATPRRTSAIHATLMNERSSSSWSSHSRTLESGLASLPQTGHLYRATASQLQIARFVALTLNVKSGAAQRRFH